MIINESVRVVQTVDDIGKEVIDSIATDGFFTYGYFKTLEISNPHNIELFYIVVYENAEIVGFAPCFFDSLDNHLFSKTSKQLLSFGCHLRLFQNRILVCSSPHSFHSQILIKESLRKKNVFDLVLRKVDEICKDEGVRLSLFPFVSEFDSLLVSNLQGWGYVNSSSVPNMHLAVEWSSFDNYLKSLDNKTRQNIRREIRKCRESGVTISEEPEFGGFASILSDLQSNLFSRYNNDAKSPFDASYFQALSKYARDKTKLLIARKQGKIVGFSLSMQHKNILDVHFCGFDYEHQTKTDFTYFNVTYDSPIQLAINEGITTIHFRRAAEEIKIKRGCKPEETYGLLKCQNRLIGLIFHLYSKIRLQSINNTRQP